MKVGLIGLGAMGRMHFNCWRKSNAATARRDQRPRPAEAGGRLGQPEFQHRRSEAEQVDLSGYRLHTAFEDLIADPAVELVDICLPTPFHAPLSIAALRAGKHVFCEKPMSLKLDECAAMQAAAREAGRQLMIGHCLRYWPHYTKAHELLASGEFGRALYARFHRSSAMPVWSVGGWLQKAAESGGVLDMHIHDIDVALWWFGRSGVDRDCRLRARRAAADHGCDMEISRAGGRCSSMAVGTPTAARFATRSRSSWKAGRSNTISRIRSRRCVFTARARRPSSRPKRTTPTRPSSTTSLRRARRAGRRG